MSSHIDAADGLVFRKTDDNRWLVTVDGAHERTITKDGSSFIAWIGCRDRHWSFQRALDACADHARFHHEACAMAKARNEAARDALAARSPGERDQLIAALEAERDLLDYADAHMDVPARKAAIDSQIAAIRAA
ncbi:MAG TPA: hypothetical protein VGV39_20175 [Mesorhizobium sp.]|uniref:hypothetical protein n=1 Tax=Mesorhizobium sp. TaxID=1871066 RepID=UPI002DDD6B41|nr:hypothetical protein [Mesorhizobium sp.]HEV2505405.1 hypothetical protein [Mesorhizobium sp.]